MHIVALTLMLSASDPAVISEADRVIYKQTTVVDFQDVELLGEVTRPEGDYSLVRRRSRFGTLVRAKSHMVGELEASIEQL